jgi:hypothetical protein
MRLPIVLKLVFGLLYILWVVALYMSMPPEGVVETVLVLASAAAIFVIGYFFHLFLIRAVIRLFSKRPDRGWKAR